MSYFEFDGKQVYYGVEGEGEPLLLLHGNSISSNIFKHITPKFKDHFKVFYFDYPGIGKSERVEKFRDDYWYYNGLCGFELMDKLGIEKTNIIGTSGGALVGLNMASTEPGRVKKLVADSFGGDYLTEEEAKKFNARRTKLAENKMSQMYFKNHIGDDWREVLPQDMDLMERVGKHNLKIIKNNLGDIKARVLGVATSEDELPMDVPARVKAVCDKIPKARTKFFDYGAHTFMITESEDFAGIAKEFLL